MKHEFSAQGVENFYNAVMQDVYDAMDDGTVSSMTLNVKMGNQEIVIPLNADYLQDMLEMIKQFEKDR